MKWAIARCDRSIEPSAISVPKWNGTSASAKHPLWLYRRADSFKTSPSVINLSWVTKAPTKLADLVYNSFTLGMETTCWKSSAVTTQGSNY
jgi:hypothetical protein